MDNKGFLLIQVLMGLFLLGLILVIALPLLNTAIFNLEFAKIKRDMISTAEAIIEQIKSYNYKNEDEMELVFDMKLIDIIETFKAQIETNISLPLDKESSEYKYICNIFKIEKDNLWEIRVSISFDNEVRKTNDIEITALLPIPK